MTHAPNNPGLGHGVTILIAARAGEAQTLPSQPAQPGLRQPAVRCTAERKAWLTGERHEHSTWPRRQAGHRTVSGPWKALSVTVRSGHFVTLTECIDTMLTYLMSILKMWKPRLRKVKRLAQGLTARKWRSQDGSESLRPQSLCSESPVLSSPHCPAAHGCCSCICQTRARPCGSGIFTEHCSAWALC